jgi:group I intron endonuclease
MIIYKIVNSINGKVYIGQTSRTIEQRWKEYRNDAKRRPTRPIENAISKYGIDNFTIEVIYTANSINDLNSKEIELIKFYNSTDRNMGYNIEIGGKNSPMSEETKIKLSNSHKGKKFTEEHKDKIRKANTGKKKSPEEVERMRQFHLGRKRSDEIRKKYSEARKGEKNYWYGKELPQKTKDAMIEKNSKPIKRSDGKIYKSISCAAKEMNIHVSAISNQLRGKTKTCCGYKFEFIKKEDMWK